MHTTTYHAERKIVITLDSKLLTTKKVVRLEGGDIYMAIEHSMCDSCTDIVIDRFLRYYYPFLEYTVVENVRGESNTFTR